MACHSQKARTPVGRYHNLKANAKQRDLEFDLSREEVKTLLESSCDYCGKEAADGIDRVDSNLGYESSNVVPCCFLCNTAKSNLSREEFYAWVERVYLRKRNLI